MLAINSGLRRVRDAFWQICAAVRRRWLRCRATIQSALGLARSTVDFHGVVSSSVIFMRRARPDTRRHRDTQRPRGLRLVRLDDTPPSHSSFRKPSIAPSRRISFALEAMARRGDIIFQIDRARFALALQQADAVVAGRRASLDQAESDLKRYRQLTTLAVSQQKQEQVLATEQQAKAAYDQAVADRAVAQLNLDRSVVHASVNGTISNMDLRPGTYVTAGKGVMALVDSDTLHVDGYFEETKLPRIQVGDRVAIRLMGNAVPLRGHVESIAAGIEDRDRAQGASLLADVNPTFSWVRLAQRVPVRVSLDAIPANVTLCGGPHSDCGGPVAEASWPGLAFWFRWSDVAAQQSQLASRVGADPAQFLIRRSTTPLQAQEKVQGIIALPDRG